MALFKILKGNKENLSETSITEGWMYITQDTGDTFVDVSASDRM